MKNLSIIGALVALLLLVNSAYVVKESEVGLLFQLGRIQTADLGPGLHFKLPVLQDAKIFDRRILTLDAPPERYLTSEKKDVNVDFFAKWRIKDVRTGDMTGIELRTRPGIKDDGASICENAPQFFCADLSGFCTRLHQRRLLDTAALRGGPMGE